MTVPTASTESTAPLEVAIAEARRGATSYPVFASRLKAAGVVSYHADVPSHTIVYRFASMDDSGGTTTYTEHGTPVVPETERQQPRTYSAEGVRQAILANQQGATNYQTFLEQIWESGVTHYTVDLEAAQITYSGATGEAYVESIPAPMSKAIGGIKNIVVHPGKEAEFERLFAELREYVRKEDTGNLCYDLYRSRSHASTYVVTERYRDQAAWQAHQDSEYGRVYFPKIRTLLATISVEYFESVE